MPVWTVPELFLRVLRSLRRQPLSLLFALALVPGAWAVPAELAYEHWVPSESRVLGAGRPALAALLSFAGLVWNCLWSAGGTRIGIDAARGHGVRFRHLLEGVAYTPWMVCTALAVLPLELFVVLSLDGDSSSTALVFGSVIVVTLVLLARTALWAAFLLDGSTSILGALSASWEATRELTGRIILLGSLMFVPVLPLAALELTFTGHAFGAVALWSLLYTLAVGHLYVLSRDGAKQSLQKA